MRRALGDGRARPADERRSELDILTYDGVRMRVGPTSDDELERDHRRRRPARRDLQRAARRCATLRRPIRARFPHIPRRVSGYNLDELLPENGFHVARALVGTEGTCVMVLEATLRLCRSPPQRALVVLGYPDVYEAGRPRPARC